MPTGILESSIKPFKLPKRFNSCRIRHNRIRLSQVLHMATIGTSSGLGTAAPLQLQTTSDTLCWTIQQSCHLRSVQDSRGQTCLHGTTIPTATVTSQLESGTELGVVHAHKAMPCLFEVTTDTPDGASTADWQQVQEKHCTLQAWFHMRSQSITAWGTCVATEPSASSVLVRNLVAAAPSQRRFDWHQVPPIF
jgi:hypothetical protein